MNMMVLGIQLLASLIVLFLCCVFPTLNWLLYMLRYGTDVTKRLKWIRLDFICAAYAFSVWLFFLFFFIFISMWCFHLLQAKIQILIGLDLLAINFIVELLLLFFLFIYFYCCFWFFRLVYFPLDGHNIKIGANSWLLKIKEKTKKKLHTKTITTHTHTQQQKLFGKMEKKCAVLTRL